jgi:hypothetical protein
MHEYWNSDCCANLKLKVKVVVNELLTSLLLVKYGSFWLNDDPVENRLAQ